MIPKGKIEQLREARPARFLVVKFGSLGDVVHCLPSVAQLREAFPHAEIDWLIEQKNKIVVELSGLNVRLFQSTRTSGGTVRHRQRQKSRNSSGHSRTDSYDYHV